MVREGGVLRTCGSETDVGVAGVGVAKLSSLMEIVRALMS
jgi:hypothetical protein